VSARHAFISYVHEDASHVDQLQRALEAAGVSVWRDTANLWPGEDWRMKIRQAITSNALVFIACFSSHSIARVKSRQNEELALAIDQLRMRRPDVPWLIPLASIQGADLFGEDRDAGVRRLLTTLWRLLEQDNPEQEADERVPRE
jgi:TIR domain